MEIPTPKTVLSTTDAAATSRVRRRALTTAGSSISAWRSANPSEKVFFATSDTGQATSRNMQGIVDALNKSQATIEFDLQGNILTANDLFLNTLGYTMAELKGRHHSTFVDEIGRAHV